MRKSLAVLVAITALIAVSLPALAFSGKVITENGKPIAGAKVDIRPDSGGVETVTTDKAGAFKLDLPKPDELVSVLITAKGRAYAGNRFRGDEQVTFTALPEREVKVKVIDENGNPVQGARVALESLNFSSNSKENQMIDGWTWKQDGDWSRGIIYEVTTGQDGTAVLQHLPEPSGLNYCYGEMEVTKGNRAVVYKNLTDTDTRNNLVVIVDPLECKMQGTLYLPDRSGPVSGHVSLSITRLGSSYNDQRNTTVDKDGKFTFSKIAPGNYRIELSYIETTDYQTQKPTGVKESWVMPAAQVTLAPDKIVTRDLTLQEGVHIKGKVVEEGTNKLLKTGSLLATHPGRPSEDAPMLLSSGRKEFKDGEFSFYAVPGEVDIWPQSIDRVQYFNDDRPHLTFTVAPGESKTDLILSIDLSNAASAGTAPKSIPTDLALVPGRYTLQWDQKLDTSTSIRPQHRYSGDDAKRHILKLPKFVSANAKFYATSLDGTGDDGLLVYALDESIGTGSGYNTLYLDINRNRDLTDDESIRIPAERYSRSPWTEVKSHQGPLKGEHAENPWLIRININQSQDEMWTSITCKGGWKGTIDTNRGKSQCVVVDTNANGIYGEPIDISDDYQTSPYAGDSIYIDLNASGRISMDYNSPHLLSLQDVSIIANKPYQIRVNAKGDEISVAEYNGPMGKFLPDISAMKKSGAHITDMVLIGKKGFYDLKKYNGAPINLPAGKYKLSNCTISFKQSDGKDLNLACTPDVIANIAADKESVYRIGGKLSINGIDPDKKVVYMTKGHTSGVGLYADLGDNVSITRIGGTGDYKSYYPTVKLFDKSNKLVYTGLSRYT